MGVPTRYCTGGSEARIWARTSSVGMPRSISQMRWALPYCRSMRSRKSFERRLVGGVAGQHLIGQRQSFGRDDQRDDHLHAIGPMIARVAVTALVAFRKRRIGLEIGARQIVEKNVEPGVEQIPPAARQMIEHRLLVRQQKIMAGVKLVALGKTEILAQKIGKRTLAKPFAMQPPFAARREQPIGHQHEQHQIPARALAIDAEPFLPEAIELQLLPQAQRQPARAPLARPFQAKLAKASRRQQTHPAEDRRNDPRGTATASSGRSLPSSKTSIDLRHAQFLAVVDLAQIKHVALHHPTARPTRLFSTTLK